MENPCCNCLLLGRTVEKVDIRIKSPVLILATGHTESGFLGNSQFAAASDGNDLDFSASGYKIARFDGGYRSAFL